MTINIHSDSQSVAADLSVSGAERLVEEIRTDSARLLEDLSHVLTKIQRLHEGRGWLALGYISWEALCESELNSLRVWTTVEERINSVAALRDGGMSIRAVSAALGVGRGTVMRDAELSGVPNGTPDNAGQGVESASMVVISGNDGKEYAAQTSVENREERQARVRELHEEGKTQQEIARELKVSQGTVSGDLTATSPMMKPGAIKRLGEQLVAQQGDTPVAASLAEVYIRDLHSASKRIHDEVIFSDDWVVETKRQQIVAELSPGLADVLLVVVRAITEIPASDLPDDESDRLRWTQTLNDAHRMLGAALS